MQGHFLKGCKAFRLIAAALILLVGLLALTALSRLDVGSFLLAVVLASGAGHAAGRSLERIVGSWTTFSIWREEQAAMNEVVVAPFTLSRLFWFDGGIGFFVKRVNAGLLQTSVH